MTADTKREPLTRSVEDYLKAIYELETAGAGAQTSAIAAALEIAPPSVSGMLRRLSDAGMLRRVPYRGVHLTPKGRRSALRMLRRHRVIETYLASKLGYGWDSVHDEAERLEHAVSDELIERMAMALGNPRHDPHGAPIPSRDGDVEEQQLVPLTEVPVGHSAELRLVSDRDGERLRYLGALGLKPGVMFEVVGRQPFRGPVTIRIHGRIPREEIIGRELADDLLCLPAEAEVG